MSAEQGPITAEAARDYRTRYSRSRPRCYDDERRGTWHHGVIADGRVLLPRAGIPSPRCRSSWSAPCFRPPWPRMVASPALPGQSALEPRHAGLDVHAERRPATVRCRPRRPSDPTRTVVLGPWAARAVPSLLVAQRVPDGRPAGPGQAATARPACYRLAQQDPRTRSTAPRPVRFQSAVNLGGDVRLTRRRARSPALSPR